MSRKASWLALAGFAACCATVPRSVIAADTSPVGTPSGTEVLQAAVKGQSAQLRELLKRGGNPNVTALNGSPAIFFAISSKDADTVQVLLDADPSIAKQSFKDTKGQVETPLAYALYLKQPIVVAALIKAGVDVTAASAGIGTIELAVFGNDTESLRLLVEAGADPKKLDGHHGTLLHLAATEERPEVIMALLGYGVDPNHRDDYGVSPLRVAVEGGKLASARTLLEHGAWTYPLDSSGTAALSAAKIRIKDPQQAEAMEKLLLSHQAPANGNNRPVDDVYLTAVRAGDLAAVKSALTRGADIDARARFTLAAPITEAPSLAVPHPQVLAYLIERGINVNACSSYGFTALHTAASRGGNLQSIDLLIKHGVDINQKSRGGETALGRAVNGNLPSAVELLLKLGADPNAKGIGGRNLLQLAREGSRSTLIAPMLEKAGAQ